MAIAEIFRELQGYAETQNREPEINVEKVAIFASGDGRVTHMARQLASGAWTSKLGRDEDIEHSDLSVLENGEYGGVVLVLARPFKPLPQSGETAPRPSRE